MYVLANGQEIIEYPYSLRKLKQDNPNVSFPSHFSEELLASYGVYFVNSESAPELTTTRIIAFPIALQLTLTAHGYSAVLWWRSRKKKKTKTLNNMQAWYESSETSCYIKAIGLNLRTLILQKAKGKYLLFIVKL